MIVEKTVIVEFGESQPSWTLTLIIQDLNTHNLESSKYQANAAQIIWYLDVFVHKK